jgi:hypothetical protein
MLPKKIESVNNLVDEEPKDDYENINVTWMQTILIIRPFDLKKKIRASIRIPIGYNKDIQQLNQKAYDTWVFTNSLPHLTTIEEKGEYWQHLLQSSIFELQFDH